MRELGVSRYARRVFARHARVEGSAFPLWSRAEALEVVRDLTRIGDWDVETPARSLRFVTDELRRAAVASLALTFPEGRPVLALPEDMRALHGRALDRLAAWFDSGAAYDDDSFAKDVRLVAGLSTPAGVQDLDVGVSPTVSARLGRVRRAAATLARLAAQGDTASARRFAAAAPASPWLQIHTDSRWLDEFHEAGWDACYARIAGFLALNPAYAGVVGQSWFYDPAVAEISPRLAYLQERPLANGAIRVRLGASPLDVQRATATSDSRRKLYEAGAYQPRCWAIFWPRAEILAWAATFEAQTERRAA